MHARGASQISTYLVKIVMVVESINMPTHLYRQPHSSLFMLSNNTNVYVSITISIFKKNKKILKILFENYCLN